MTETTQTTQPDSPLDTAWENINVLGAPDTACTTDYERGYCKAIGDALAEIEKLGGSSPMVKRAMDFFHKKAAEYDAEKVRS